QLKVMVLVDEAAGVAIIVIMASSAGNTSATRLVGVMVAPAAAVTKEVKENGVRVSPVLLKR
ncbi:MAG TPA: hypothetical protein PLJ11_08980, partial [Methanomassiliicoccales archaeon]|nr:hypothetical protein [Methanomassiliicoccales archaeon]